MFSYTYCKIIRGLPHRCKRVYYSRAEGNRISEELGKGEHQCFIFGSRVLPVGTSVKPSVRYERQLKGCGYFLPANIRKYFS